MGKQEFQERRPPHIYGLEFVASILQLPQLVLWPAHATHVLSYSFINTSKYLINAVKSLINTPREPHALLTLPPLLHLRPQTPHRRLHPSKLFLQLRRQPLHHGAYSNWARLQENLQPAYSNLESKIICFSYPHGRGVQRTVSLRKVPEKGD